MFSGPPFQLFEPCAGIFRVEYHAAGTMNKERPQISIAAFAYSQQIYLATGTGLPGYQTKPRCELAAIPEGVRMSHGHCRSCCRQKTHARYCCYRLACLILFHPGLQTALDLGNLLIQCLQATPLFAKRINECCRQVSG
jgi:hypothetical protein